MRTAEATIITFNAVLWGAVGISAVSGGSPLLITSLGFLGAAVAAAVTCMLME